MIAADVNIFASSPHDAVDLVGNRENTEVGGFLASYLDLDLDAITKKLKNTNTQPQAAGQDYSWMGKPLAEDVVVDELDVYHGDFKRSLSKRGRDVNHINFEGCGCGASH